jgi:hypothetical protein
MVPVRRRTLLRGACGLAAAVAGCNGLVGSDGETSSPTATVRDGSGESDGMADPNTDAAAYVRRFDTDRQPVWLGTDERPTANDRLDRIGTQLLHSRTAADRLRVDERFDRTGIDEFLAETAFDGETVYLQTVTVGECFRLRLCDVSWDGGGISTDYSRQMRPYDERCAVDTEVYEVWFIRLPEALATDEVTSFSTSIGGGPCTGTSVRTERHGEGSSGPGAEGGTGTDEPVVRRDG